MSNSIQDRGQGLKQNYLAPLPEVWAQVIEIIAESDLDLVIADQQQGLVLAQSPISAFSYGENVAIFINSEGKTTNVEVVNRLALKTTIFATDWEENIHAQLAIAFPIATRK